MDNSSVGDGGMTDRSDATDGTMTSRGPASQFKLARYGKVKELEKVITKDNVDNRDDNGNTCLHHACMQNKKRCLAARFSFPRPPHAHHVPAGLPSSCCG
eukprot:80280-Hanusia_phi.AAC.1